PRGQPPRRWGREGLARPHALDGRPHHSSCFPDHLGGASVSRRGGPAMSRSMKAPRRKSSSRSQPDILAMLRALDTEAPPILDELEHSEAVAILDELLTWLREIQPRVRSYLTRRTM